jgi:hypothetical protein
MKSNSRTSEDLVKRAKYGGRNVSGLAILASVLAAFMLIGAIAVREGDFLAAAIAALCVAVGYWLLAIPTRRGETLGLGIIISTLTVQFLLSLAGQVFIHVKTDGTNALNLIWIIIPLLIIMALAGNRADLIELQNRGLSGIVFGTARPVKNICVFGGLLLFGGLVGLYASLIFSGVDAARSARFRHDFVVMINADERALMEILANANRETSNQFWATALEAAERLRDRARQIDQAADDKARIKPIASKYVQATERWCLGIAQARNDGQFSQEGTALLNEGDHLRLQAMTEFQKQFPEASPRQR